MKEISIPIKGRSWKFILMADRRFDKIHNIKEDDSNVAMTVPGTYEVHFRKSDWNISTIRHEILHVLYSASLVGSTDLSVSDVQEICAEIVGEHGLEICLWADQIAERFLVE
jgi:hypothetical protein